MGVVRLVRDALCGGVPLGVYGTLAAQGLRAALRAPALLLVVAALCAASFFLFNQRLALTFYLEYPYASMGADGIVALNSSAGQTLVGPGVPYGPDALRDTMDSLPYVAAAFSYALNLESDRGTAWGDVVSVEGLSAQALALTEYCVVLEGVPDPDGSSVLIDRDLAGRLHVRPGDWVTLRDGAGTSKDLVVTGIYPSYGSACGLVTDMDALAGFEPERAFLYQVGGPPASGELPIGATYQNKASAVAFQQGRVDEVLPEVRNDTMRVLSLVVVAGGALMYASVRARQERLTLLGPLEPLGLPDLQARVALAFAHAALCDVAALVGCALGQVALLVVYRCWLYPGEFMGTFMMQMAVALIGVAVAAFIDEE